MMNKRAQASLEFLMTYGWAIVVIMVVLMVAWQWGLFNPSGNIRPGSSGFWGITIFDVSYKSNGDLVLSLQNNVGSDLNITKINVTADGNSYSTLSGWAPLSITAGNITKWESPSGTFPGGRAGSSYNIFVSMDYVDNRLGSDIKFRSSGNIWGSVEST